MPLFLLLAGASWAQGDPGTVNSNPPERGPAHIGISGGFLADDVTVDIDPQTGEYVVTDAAGLTPGINCYAVDADTARCERITAPGAPDTFSALLNSGDDKLTMLSPRRSGTIDGGTGNDEIIGSAASSSLLGGDQDDDLRGRGGKDHVIGGPGRDAIRGGSGDDRLIADDGEADRVIDCGGGDDKARIDQRLDPKPIHCERVIRR